MIKVEDNGDVTINATAVEIVNELVVLLDVIQKEAKEIDLDNLYKKFKEDKEFVETAHIMCNLDIDSIIKKAKKEENIFKKLLGIL